MFKLTNYFQCLLFLILGVIPLQIYPTGNLSITTKFVDNQLTLSDIEYKSEDYKVINSSPEKFFNLGKNLNPVKLSQRQDSQKELQSKVKELEHKITVIENQQSRNFIIIYLILLVSISLQVISFYKKFKVTSTSSQEPELVKPSSSQLSKPQEVTEQSINALEQQKTANREIKNLKSSDSSTTLHSQGDFKQTSNAASKLTASSKFTPSTKPTKHLTSLEREIIKIYNKSPNTLSKDASEVTETENSIYQRRFGSSQSVSLESVNRGRGNYLVLSGKYSNYLVPKTDIKINEYNRNTLKALFICHNNQSGSYSNFELIKPGKVSTKSNGSKWELVDKGELRFK